jgi:hypothetical protein
MVPMNLANETVFYLSTMVRVENGHGHESGVIRFLPEGDSGKRVENDQQSCASGTLILDPNFCHPGSGPHSHQRI